MPNSICWLLPLLATSANGFPQSSARSESTRALYRGDYVQAVQLAERQLQKRPNDTAMRVLLGRAELAQGQFGPALEDLRKALASDPHNIDALYYLSFAARALSEQEYQRLLAMAPDSARVHQLLAESAQQAEDWTEAEAEFQKALQANPRSAEVATELAELKRSQSKFDEAVTYYEQAEQVGPMSYEVAYGLGACYTYKQDYARATEWLRQAVVLAPESAAGHFALGNALFQAGHFEAAIPELNVSLRFEPRMKQAYFLLGRAYTKLGRQAEATAAFKRLDDLNRSAVPAQSKELRDDGQAKHETPQ
jgi:tetratricopeptide (TPR) repeat protein